MKQTELLYQEILLIRKALERYAYESDDGEEQREADRLEQWFKDAKAVIIVEEQE